MSRVSPFQPPRRTLMGPGPSDVHARVLSAMGRPTIGHLDPAFVEFMEEVKSLLRQVMRSNNPLTFPISAPASAAMEAAIVNIVEPGDKILVAQNGVFGERLTENIRRAGGVPEILDFTWGEAVDPDRVEAAFKTKGPFKAFAFVMAETSTGVRSDAEQLATIAREHGALVIVDAVTALGGIALETDAWGLDIVYAGTQKCLSAPPGLAPITFSPAALEVIKARKTPVQSWFLDINLITRYWQGGGARSYHHTAPINALYGLHEALIMLMEEGRDAMLNRHARMHDALRAGLEAMGLALYVAEPYRLPQLNAITIPPGADDKALREHLLSEFGLEIGAGLGSLAGKIWRIGLMGQSADERHVTLCLQALEAALSRQGVKIDKGKALPAAMANLREP